MARILTISSWVARGHVGNAASGPALMRRGHETISLPTVVLAHHPGHAPGVARVAMPDVLGMGADALSSPRPHPVDAVVAGYCASAAQVAAIAGLVARARAARPGGTVPFVLDPVCGDAGALYVDPAIVAETAARLLPMADVATPNVTELAALVGGDVASAPGWPLERIAAAARTLARPAVVVTTVPPGAAGRAATLVIEGARAWRVETPRVDVAVNGTGDLFAGLLAAGIVEGMPTLDAAAIAAAAVHDVLAETRRRGGDELALVAAQDRLVAPAIAPDVTEIMAE